ncbi:MAG: glycosyltransferase family 4 protein [Moheibacter sp.]
MKILIIHQYFKESDITGGARFNEMARIWKEEGHEITVIAGNLDVKKGSKKSEYKNKFVTRKKQNGLTVYRCNVSESYNKDFLGRLWGYFSFVISGSYAGLFKIKERHDVVVVTSPPLFVGIIGYILTFFKKTPLVFEIRDLWPESAIDTGILKSKPIIRFAYWFEKFIYKKATLISVLTPAFRQKLITDKQVPEEKIIMIPNAADFIMSDRLLESFDADSFRKEKGWEDKFVITYVGAHGVANGLNQLLGAAKRLKDTNVLFVLVGDGMKKKELVETSKKENIDNVLFYDSVPKNEVLKFILASDIGTSVLLKNDTFKTVYSNKTFDYMSCKKPILMAIDGVSKELVENAGAGVFVEPENPLDFEEKVRFYLNNQELLTIQGENGYKYAKSHFDRAELANRYLKFLLQLNSK